jgi:hypothetical protein
MKHPARSSLVDMKRDTGRPLPLIENEQMTSYYDQIADKRQEDEDKLDRVISAHERARAVAHRALMSDLLKALESGAADVALVATPAFARKTGFALACVAELMAYPQCAPIELSLWSMLAELAKSDHLNTRYRVQAWLSRVANAHADLHADDAVGEVLEVRT